MRLQQSEQDDLGRIPHQHAKPPARPGHAALLRLQRTAGNAAVAALMKPAPKDEPDVAVQRAITFTPFAAGQMVPGAHSMAALTLDVLNSSGLSMPGGGTTGNSVNLERMLSNTGGGSAPGYPAEFEDLRLVDTRLVRARGQQNAATAMHAINADFVVGANNDPGNIFMGSAVANREHFNKVEGPIRRMMKSNHSGAAATYEAAIQANPPTPLTHQPGVLGWNVPGLNMPGVFVPNPGQNPAPLPALTHILSPAVVTATPQAPRWPKLIEYQVTPAYTYGAHPGLPPFLLANLQVAQNDVNYQESLALTDPARVPQQNIDFEKAAIAKFKTIAHLLFPQTYTCTATYWLATYDPAAPWSRFTQSDVFDAEL